MANSAAFFGKYLKDILQLNRLFCLHAARYCFNAVSGRKFYDFMQRCLFFA
jgi:hypothetical protein